MSESNAFPVFKKSTLEDTAIGNKKRTWKSLKQILATERTLQWPENAVTSKKYSDISGLIASYTYPQSKLNYHNSEEFATVRNLPSDLTAGYLALRGASSIVG